MTLRRERVQFSSRKIQERAGLGRNISNIIIRRCLQKHGYRYRQSRKRGFLTTRGLVVRLRYARKHITHTPPQILDFTWTVSRHGQYPQWPGANQARGWKLQQRERREAVGAWLSFLQEYHTTTALWSASTTLEKWLGRRLRNSLARNLQEFLRRLGWRKVTGGFSRITVLDRMQEWHKEHGRHVAVKWSKFQTAPQISTRLNLVHKKLREDTYNQNIERESYDEFVARIKKTIANLISSMPRRLAAVVRHKGHRTMYWFYCVCVIYYIYSVKWKPQEFTI